MEKILDALTNAGSFLMIGFYLLVGFPGGAITMAVACKASKLDGWDWVLSVIVPAYGLISAFMC